MSNTKSTNRGFIGDFLGSISSGIGGIVGTGLGGPIGGILGSGLGSALSPIARGLPFQMGGKIPKGFHRMPDGSLMKNSAMKKGKGKKAMGMVKGSMEAKMKMKKLRAMRK